ncbi:MAG: tungsten formylmethanofuran dehydrogenase [Candidatus Eisenbacteria bacterium]|nr:tungsten formylmethanofuran dehydrogenase [Candidatus Latescibacterota bacterium]MBD3302486.1 tungsten formylmethanofuran dehydrogenase [Candidatus Eisenbacteria bacterium]
MADVRTSSKSNRKTRPRKKKGDATASSSPELDLLAIYRTMLLTRRLDEKMMILLKQGKSFFHIGASGHEAIQVAAAAAMRPGRDWSYPYYRDLAFCLQTGMTAEEVMLCFLSRAEDPNSGGRQMPAHYGHRDLRIVSQSSPTGSQFLQAVGSAMASKLGGTDEVVYVSAGEGTTSQGDFHEALNWASREKLPVIFCIQDNKYAISVHISQQTTTTVHDLCGGYVNLRRYPVDGTDLLASYDVMREAVEGCRAGKGPAVVIADVVRLLPHSSSDNQAKYRDAEELEAERERDPIPRLESVLFEEGILDKEQAEEIRKEVKSAVDDAADYAASRPMPDPSTALDHVYASREHVPPEGGSETPKATGEKIVLVDAINHALSEEMERNPKVVVYGEDVEDHKGGVFTATTGLSVRFGSDRVFNSPLAESSIVGTAIGLACSGFRPVVEIQFGDYIWPAMNQIRNELAMMRYRSAGNWSCPAVVRVPVGGYIHGALYHSQNIEATFAHFPGLYVLYPSTAPDAKGLLKTAIRGEDPVLFLEHKGLYRQLHASGPEPDAEFLLPFGKARIAREGEDATIVTYGALVKRSLDAAAKAASRGVSVEVIDLRTILPWDREAVLESVKKTGRVLVVHEDMLTGGFGAEVAAVIASEGFEFLDAPVRRLGGADSPVPYNWDLEAVVLPQLGDVQKALDELIDY